MTQHLTRRELREAERRGESISLQQAAPQAPTAPQSRPPETLPPIQHQTLPPAQPQLTRRQMREQGLFGASPRLEAPVQSATVTPAHSDSRRARRAAYAEPMTIDAPEVDFPEPTFAGQNLFSEPSTESIVLETMPEAISMPIETGEIAITGSIEVISGPMTGPSTAALEGMDGLDSEEGESVTGVISTVAPISALQLIDERSSFVAVPTKVLRRGWWKPYAVGVGAIGLVIAAILSVMTILSAVGG